MILSDPGDQAANLAWRRNIPIARSLIRVVYEVIPLPSPRSRNKGGLARHVKRASRILKGRTMIVQEIRETSVCANAAGTMGSWQQCADIPSTERSKSGSFTRGGWSASHMERTDSLRTVAETIEVDPSLRRE